MAVHAISVKGVSSSGTAAIQLIQQLGDLRFEDIDCDDVRGTLVDWSTLRQQVVNFDDSWNIRSPPPLGLCPTKLPGREWDGELGAALRQASSSEVADECPMGSLAASAFALACDGGCGATGSRAGVGPAQRLWRTVLASEESGRSWRVPYLLGTSAWPVGAILAKLAFNCSRRGAARGAGFADQCQSSWAWRFLDEVSAAAESYLTPLLEGREGQVILMSDSRLDFFAMSALPAMRRMGPNQDLHPSVRRLMLERASCDIGVATREALLLLLRHLGAPVARDIDPLAQPRLARLAALLGGLPLPVLLRFGWPLFAMLAVSHLNTWRSHRLYTSAQVRIYDLQRVVSLVAAELPHTQGDLLTAFHRSSAATRWAVWTKASLRRPGRAELGASSRRIVRWIMEAPHDVPAIVYLTMFWGDMGNSRWVAHFLGRAMAVGIPRFIFLSPDDHWLEQCEEVSAAWYQLGETYRRLLCARSFAPFARPYDVNNYAKFVLLPLLITIGMRYAWLDVDIFLFQDPTWRLLELSSEERSDGSTVDVFTTDHFDEHCLNHGVIMVQPSDRTLLWALSYIEWMHEYPFGHDQNGWDAFLGHSIVDESQVPPNPGLKLAVLDTAREFLTLTGWSGAGEAELRQALLLHMTRTTPIVTKEKRERIVALWSATVPGNGGGLRRAVLEEELPIMRDVLAPLFVPPLAGKRECYEGIHIATSPLVEDGSYWELFS